MADEEAVSIIEAIYSKARTAKRKHHYRKGWPLVKYCLVCLNFEQTRKVHVDEGDHFCYNKYTVVGSCHAYGWDVSAFDACDSWQDDA